MAEEIDRYLAACLRGETAGWSCEWGDIRPVWDRVRFHGIAGLLARQPVADWPDALRALISEEARIQAFWEESHRAMLTGLLEVLAAHGVRNLLMKGSALAYSTYPDPSTRRRGDSDLLVMPGQLAVTRRLLVERGFTRRDDPHGLFFQEVWLSDTGIGIVHALDLHWQPSDSPALQPVLPAKEFFATSQPLPRLSPHAAMPSAVLTFMQGALNQAWHGAKGYFVGEERLAGEGRLVWAWDNHFLAAGFSDNEWSALAELAIRRDVAALCLAALELARDRCATRVPNHVLEWLREAPQDTLLVRHLKEKNRIAAFFTDLAAIPELRARYAFVLGHTLPHSRHLRRKYPAQSHWPLPLLHMRRIAEAAIRLARLR